MNARTRWIAALAAAALLAAAGASASAQSSATAGNAYQEPQIVKLGTATTPPAGKGP